MTVIGGITMIVASLLPILLVAAVSALRRVIGESRRRSDTTNEDS